MDLDATPSPANLLRLKDAARELSISYPTLKQWIYKKKIRTAKTAGGHHRIPRSEIIRMSRTGKSTKKPVGIEAISGRNKFLGTIIGVKIDGLLAQITLDIGGHYVSAIVTRDACEQVGLKVGVKAYALVKATEVMVVRA